MSVTIEIPKEVTLLCGAFQIKPENLLNAFMNDLCSLPGNGGSDERSMAKDYFLRGHNLPDGDYNDANEIVRSFESMYKENYPSVGNKDYAAKRIMQLVEWQQLVKSLLKRNAI